MNGSSPQRDARGAVAAEFLPALETKMNQPLRIGVADDEPEMLDYYRQTLAALGHEIVAQASTGAELIEQCRRTRPDLVITDIKMPDKDGLEAAVEISRERPTPVVLVSAYHDAELIARALQDHVLAYLVKPIKQADLETAVALAMRRFQEFQALHKQSDDLRQALADRKLVERAKGSLMARGGLDEPTAFRRLQKMAADKNLKLVEVARALLLAEEVYQPPK